MAPIGRECHKPVLGVWGQGSHPVRPPPLCLITTAVLDNDCCVL